MLSEKTAVSIGLLIALLGGAGFITKVAYQSEANAAALTELKDDIKTELRMLRSELKELRLELKQERTK